jgi:putative intracellular protease/amidase
VRTAADDRFIADAHLRTQLRSSQPIAAVDMASYDIVYLAGGWGAAFDLGVSDAVGNQMSVAIASGAAIGGVCHGPLGLLRARMPDGAPAVRGRHLTAVTDKQIRELGIGSTPQHPERDLRAAGAVFESATARRDVLANHWVVDGRFVTGQNQNAGPMVARELMTLAAQPERTAPA